MQYLVEVRASAIGYYEVDIDTISELCNFEIHSVERV